MFLIISKINICIKYKYIYMKEYIEILKKILKNFSVDDDFVLIIKNILIKIFDIYYLKRNVQIYNIDNLFKKYNINLYNLLKQNII